ncbi:Lipase (class 3) [Chitinophaga jiangningensis]|uniref:Lipase (Class 3) n=1 Tax=Chitinophaga jiangningensis TaxID=1419482 RepID=A0A1M7KC70_9BACT|nr:lipase family protein [Chitinophaga jiangningensis]SHM62816.1 Lipase (class 3) [Chitinophaga jiangningensis]
MEKMILHMWDASSLAGTIKNNQIDQNSHSGDNSPAIKTVYSDLKPFTRNVYLIRPKVLVPHMGFVATAETAAGNVPVISFKGTDGKLDGANNLLLGWEKFQDGSNVHSAFYTAITELFPDIWHDRIVMDAIKSKAPIYLTGHSKGGALATLLARMISLKAPGTKLNVYTFGAPRVGDAKFARNYENDKNIDHLRVESFGDLIPHLPLSHDEFTLPNSYTDVLIADLAPSASYNYVSVGKYYPVNVDNTTYNRERVKPAPSKINTSQNDLNAYYVAIQDFNRDKNIFGDKHGVYFPSYSTNRSVSVRR